MTDPSDQSALSSLRRSERLSRLSRQLRRQSPFQGDITPQRISLFEFRSGRSTLPFPHPWNYKTPLRILDTFFWRADQTQGSGRHNRYLDVPGFAPVLVTRDPAVIEAISKNTGDQPGQFDRSTLPSVGIARATGTDSLLYANGAQWKRQKQLSAPPFARITLFQPEQFEQFAKTFWHTAQQRLEALQNVVASSDIPPVIELMPEIKPVMLEMLVNTFFGADLSYDDIRNRYVPALDCVIDHIVSDTVINRLGIPLHAMPPITKRLKEVKHARHLFEQLTDIALSGRSQARGQWGQFRSDAPDELLRSNIRVFLAGALEATTSFASWTVAHLARNETAQQRLYEELKDINAFTPEALKNAKYLGYVLDETLRLTPALYFHPRKATVDTWITTRDDLRLCIPAGTHILLDVWHANRHEDHWGVEQTGYPADEFHPLRWEEIANRQDSKRWLHFGFGHGPRFCPGKSLGMLETALVVGVFVKLFRFRALTSDCPPIAGVSTKPADGAKVELHPREQNFEPATSLNT